jgi:hypothetical protein
VEVNFSNFHFAENSFELFTMINKLPITVFYFFTYFTYLSWSLKNELRISSLNVFLASSNFLNETFATVTRCLALSGNVHWIVLNGIHQRGIDSFESQSLTNRLSQICRCRAKRISKIVDNFALLILLN